MDQGRGEIRKGDLMMCFSVILSKGMIVVGGVLLLIALLLLTVSILSFIERLKYGPGLFFADVEFFGLIVFSSGIAGVMTVLIAKRHPKEKGRMGSNTLSPFP
jgi:hypothetical protein